EVKLLGSTAFSSRKNSIQIPDVSGKPDFRHLAGRAIYSNPVRLFDPISKKPASFETTFTFQIDGARSPNRSQDQNRT
ncbi:hypothetical protein, partial [Klebsiella pneumoniae]|uniref:hypothetical protein n=1 Tax=Klebsiella pneumoniae TaxID=573 RepID=UPI0034DFAE7B